ncbi:MAG TPA: 1-acyl-sn-glycerol-3-phosphate acyltransferase [Anaeromyxobacter sp.]
MDTPRFPRTWRQRAVIVPLARALRLWYRPRLHGLEGVPRERPVVYVAKHPRTWLYLEVILLGLETFWDGARPAFRPMEQRGTSLHRVPGLAWLRRNVGAIAATEPAGLAALAGGESVLVFPGGARELYGPPDGIDWRGRRGFARIAARAGAPVVPLAIGGADRQHPLRLPLGARRSLWLPPVPLPVPLDFLFGAPLPPPAAGDPAGIAALADRAARETRALIAQAAATRRAPWSLA